MSPSRVKVSASLLAGIATLSLAACSGSGDDGSTGASTGSKTVEVFAAASLNAAGADLEKAYEEANPGVDITFNYAGSSKLVQQMEQGATPDILVTADRSTMDGALQSVSDLEGVTPETVATNSLVLATSAGNPANLTGLSDLAGDITVAICAPEVPCGKLAHQELDNLGTSLQNASEEKNVSDVSSKVSTGAVDAGFIYSTDAAVLEKDQDITVFSIDDLERNEYPLAVTKQGDENQTAKDFATWMEGEQAQEILASYGFGSAD